MPNYLSPGVYVEEVEAGSRPIEGVGTAVAAFVGFADSGPLNQPTLVSNWTQFAETFGDFQPDTYLAHAVYGYMQNGGNNCFIVRIGSGVAGATNGSSPTNGNGAAAGQQPEVGPPQAILGGLTMTAIGSAARKSVTIEVTDASPGSSSTDQFKLVVAVDGKPTETFDNLSATKGADYVVTKVNQKSKIITVEEPQAATVTKPANGTTDLTAPATVSDEVAVAGGVPVSPSDYVGDVARRTGFSALEAVDEVTMVAVPDLVSALEQGAIDAEGFKAVQLAVIAHCELMGDRVAILDPPPDLNAQQIKDWRVGEAGYDSKFATLYWPYAKVFDPASGVAKFVPPSGHVAGIWARSDSERGVHKAPANEIVRGAISLQTRITSAEHDLLNPVGINCIRTFPGRGIRVWGARTLSSDPAWRYLNVRRLFNYVEESILIGTQWTVFEPNDPALWARIRRTISAFLVNEWRKGALFGMTPDEAYFVKCDSETNPAEGIDAGQVVCQVGIAPVKPAEFVIFQLSQFSGGVSLVNE
ncbi:phage tail protein [Humibacillus sp. DSM 29435]|uniref:phage tail sheath family protein n=1 Tax=Humibacillus sp. DSM 29435 TaxID=1869167 RepID=UPI000872E281|nr:phage tail sheath subtilisin-like domain-containing protein [Humibacillus sp. DSM 29435]OFE15412.1 phage tail protein [Humibacillus sp. DSM 29435]